MTKKTNLSLVGHAVARLGTGYVFGTFGQILTPALLESKIRQYPTKIKNHEAYIQQHWMGMPVQDCIGLIKGHLWMDAIGQISYKSNGIPDLSANGMFTAATEKGVIATLPETKGILVWKKGHIGVYIGNGEVVESNGTVSGVIKSRLTPTVNETHWTHWLKCPFLEYVAPVMQSPYQTYLVQRGDSLWSIAQRFLGNGNRYKEIAQINGIANPSVIQINQELKIPRK